MKDYSQQFSKEFKVQDTSVAATSNTIIKPHTMYKLPILKSERPLNFQIGTPRLAFVAPS